MDAETARQHFYSETGIHEDEDCNSAASLEYDILTDAYDEIYGTLCLNDWLYGEENKAFTRFTLSALESQEIEVRAQTIVRGLSIRENPSLNNPIKRRGGWIPCEDLMPEESPEVKFFDGTPKFATLIATYQYADGNKGAGPTNYTQLADGTFEWGIIHTGMAVEVIAWMPMPKPYK